jgi:hypothetical protein
METERLIEAQARLIILGWKERAKRTDSGNERGHGVHD